LYEELALANSKDFALYNATAISPTSFATVSLESLTVSGSEASATASGAVMTGSYANTTLSQTFSTSKVSSTITAVPASRISATSEVTSSKKAAKTASKKN